MSCTEITKDLLFTPISPSESGVRNFVKLSLIRVAFAYVFVGIVVTIGGFVFRALERGVELEDNDARIFLRSQVDRCSDTFSVIRAVVDPYLAPPSSSANSNSTSVAGTVRLNLSDVLAAISFCDITADDRIGTIINDTVQETHHWTFAGSAFFVWTTITTIGYGTYAPKSFTGRGLVILFACIGIPISAWALTLLVEPVSACLSYILAQSRRNRWPKLTLAALLFTTLLFVLLAAGGVFAALEDWSYSSAVYFTFITVTTIGFGDIAPSNERSYAFAFFFVTFGLAITGSAISAASGLVSIDAWVPTPEADADLSADPSGGEGKGASTGAPPAHYVGHPCRRCRGTGVVDNPQYRRALVAPQVLPGVMAMLGNTGIPAIEAPVPPPVSVGHFARANSGMRGT
eukprot:TRINITY_DN57000_c0_g1_i1.p1 TRINITY_DN57000_c0_g1~~TRINITY_DN57000_c0_g1_i1.p1  ORF type:complete len:403 (-),score=39.95 TRINITY_DN57000_c0_g1_i1:97-1305(-)